LDDISRTNLNEDGFLEFPTSHQSVTNNWNSGTTAPFPLGFTSTGTNKRILKLIGICPMTGSARHTFLQLLNRDLPSLLVYCTICRIIHTPLPGEDKQCRDPYGGHRFNVPAGLERNSYTFLEFNYIHVVMREYRARQEYSHLLQLQCFKGRDRVEEALRRGISADFVKIIPGAFDENCFLFMTQKVFPVSAAKGWDYSARNL